MVLSKRKLVPVLLVAALAGAALMWAAASSIGLSLAPAPKLAQIAATDTVKGAPGRSMRLTYVKVPTGAMLPPHRHLGTQIARINSGTLTYTVSRGGTVTVRKGPADDSSVFVRRIKPGQTAGIKPGQWIVEQPNVHHRARNIGKKPVVLYLATLVPKGAPASTPVKDGGS